MKYTPIDEHAEDYKQAGRAFMDRAEWDFERGDLVRASEGAWEAAAQFMKAVSAQRGWGHETHIHIAQSADKIAEETGNEEIYSLFATVFAMRPSILGGVAYKGEKGIRRGMDAARKFMRILEEIPPPEDRPRYWILKPNGDWIMTYIPVDEHAEEYKQTGRWFMDQAEWEFGQGDLLQASEKMWGATAQFLKALATQRGWGHESHHHLRQVASGLWEETGNYDILKLFATAEKLHANFYEAFANEKEVRAYMDDVRMLISILEEIPTPEPPRIGYTKQKTFHRTRADA